MTQSELLLTLLLPIFVGGVIGHRLRHRVPGGWLAPWVLLVLCAVAFVLIAPDRFDAPLAVEVLGRGVFGVLVGLVDLRRLFGGRPMGR